MHNQSCIHPVTRRDFLRHSMGGLGLLAFSGFAPSFLAQTAQAKVAAPEKDRRILVLLQLAGGNDGLNTCIPYADDAYYNLRPELGIRDGRKLTDTLALHPSCDGLETLWKDGNLSILQNVGYPNPNRSHFRSTEIWETATDSDTYGHTGWLGRYFDNACDGQGAAQGGPVALHLGDELPGQFLSEGTHSIFGMPAYGKGRKRNEQEMALLENLAQTPLPTSNGDYLSHVMMDTLVTERRVQNVFDQYKPMTSYSGDALAQSLKKVAALIASGLETRVYFVSQGGYDTHANQAGNHARQLSQLSGALNAFQRDLAKHKLDDQVLTLVFSEFGRRPAQNASQGTDHGTAAPVFLLGSSLQQPVFGGPPDLVNLQNDDLRFETDFRSIYATVLADWFESDPTRVLSGNFARLPLLPTRAQSA